MARKETREEIGRTFIDAYEKLTKLFIAIGKSESMARKISRQILIVPPVSFKKDRKK